MTTLARAFKETCEDPAHALDDWRDVPSPVALTRIELVETQRVMLCKVSGESDRKTHFLAHVFYSL